MMLTESIPPPPVTKYIQKVYDRVCFDMQRYQPDTGGMPERDSPLSTLDTSWLSRTVSSSSVVRRLSSRRTSRRAPRPPRGPPKWRGGRSLTRSSEVSGVWWREPERGLDKDRSDAGRRRLQEFFNWFTCD